MRMSESFTWLELVLIVLAVGQIVDTWLRGSIFAVFRALIEVYEGQRWAELVMCFYCLSHHVPYILMILLLVMPGKFGFVLWFLVTSLAVTRATLIINGLLPEKMQYTGDKM